MIFKKPRPFELSSRVQVMGILNVTPDSFSDGGEHIEMSNALSHCKKMMQEGATIIDVGGESTRPGAAPVSEFDELQRVIPIIAALRSLQESEFPAARISIDTYKANVAKASLEAGADIINDVWGLQKDLNMAAVAASFDVPVIAMHNQENTHYDGDILQSMWIFFDQTLKLADLAGLKRSRLILDPGIGFGKTPDDNLAVLNRLSEIVAWGFPVLLGTSRKSTIGKVLDLPADQRVEGTLATTVLGVKDGVKIVRVHDVLENSRAIAMTQAIVKGIVPWR